MSDVTMSPLMQSYFDKKKLIEESLIDIKKIIGETKAGDINSIISKLGATPLYMAIYYTLNHSPDTHLSNYHEDRYGYIYSEQFFNTIELALQKGAIPTEKDLKLAEGGTEICQKITNLLTSALRQASSSAKVISSTPNPI